MVPFLENVTRGPRHPPRTPRGGRRALPPLRRALARSTTRTARCSPRSGRTWPTAGVDLPVYWGNRNWDPYLATPSSRCAADGVTPCRLLRHQRLLLVLGLPAVPREPRRRGRAEVPDARPAGQAAALLQPPRLRRRRRRRDAGRRWPTCSEDVARRAPSSCSSPTRSRGDERRQRPATGGAYVAQHRSVADVVAERVRRETGSPLPRGAGLLLALGPAAACLARARRQRPPASSSPSRARRAVVAGADRVRLRPHGGHLRPRHRGGGDRRARSGCRFRRAATAGRRPAVRGRWCATCSSSGPPSSAARRSTRAVGGPRPAVGHVPGRLLRQRRGRTAGPLRARTDESPGSSPTTRRRCSPALVELAREAARAGGREPGRRRRRGGDQDQRHRRRHRGGPGQRAADPRRCLREPGPTTAFARRGGRRRRAAPRRGALGRRPHRRHGQLPLRTAAVRRLVAAEVDGEVVAGVVVDVP